jgi:hypothetical protein
VSDSLPAKDAPAASWSQGASSGLAVHICNHD